MTEKLQKVLARAGFGSRREIEVWISEGRVSVDGVTAKLGDRVHARQVIKVNGKMVSIAAEEEQTQVIVYHKPIGEICTRKDPENRHTVFENLPPLKQGRWIAVGRLDINTSGLLLFTNNGELANKLMHPRTKIEREYAVRILGKVESEALVHLTHGVKLEDGMARFEHILGPKGSGANQWYYVVVVGGRNRLVRRLWESQGVTVSRLMRVRFGPVFLEKSLSPGQCAAITKPELQQLIKIAG